MTFKASLSLITFSASVTLPTLNHFVTLSNIFSHCFLLLRFQSIIPVVARYSSFSLLITWPKKVAWRLHIFCMSNLVVSAFRNTVQQHFFAVHKILCIHQRNHIFVASSFFCTCFEIVQALHPYIRTGSIYMAFQLFLSELMWLFVSTAIFVALALFLMQLQYCDNHWILKHPSI